MKKIDILSKFTFDQIMEKEGVTNDSVETFVNSLFISIHGNYEEDEPPYFSKNYDNVLNLVFDDVEEDIQDSGGRIARAFTREQAVELIKFIEDHKNRKYCIIHCGAGVSRSGAIGTFISDYFEKDYKEFKLQNPHIMPNGQVLAMLKRVAREWNY